MNIYWKKIGFLLPLVLLLALMIMPAASVSADSGIGVTPSSIVFQDVLPGSSSQKELHIRNLNNATREVAAKITGDSAGWVSFFPGDTISIDGNATGVLTMVVNPPQGTGPGIYDDVLLLMVKSTAQVMTGGAGAEITPGAQLPVRIIIGGTATVSLTLISGDVSLAAVGQPLGITLILENSGNVTVTPAVKVEILDEKQQSVIKTFEKALDKISPAVRATIPLSFASEGLQQDTKYWAKTTVTLDGKVIGESLSSFSIRLPSQVYPDATLLAVQTPAFATTGQIIAITAMVKNTGKNVIDAQFRGTASKGNLVAGTFASMTMSIQPGATGNLTVNFTPDQAGDYTIGGMVLYGQKDEPLYYFTQNSTALVSVSAPEVTVTPSPTATTAPTATPTPTAPPATSGGGGNNGALIGALVGGGVLLVAVLVLLWKLRHKTASKKNA